ncbi:hypothetical protein FIBSPDRAFT_947466 [Athelia psychrophila]|uniref:START domain-containing protein n=1 Tax=Athelia psychrophila TaxID=1759441 RepID=A0A166RTM3_9AGAM|nr:hypothetical protein FIBSPDRAFT_947466 [Fibularhizoctonia sp. CBS 109695]
MSDGLRLRQSWYDALSEAESHFRSLLSSHGSRDWKRVSTTTDPTPTNKGKARASPSPELADVVVHRKPGKSGDQIYRAVLDVSTGEDAVSLESWKSVLSTPELRQVWDPAVEEAHLVEMFDTMTRVSKTNYTLGWPANPRDAVTISRLFHDSSTIIDIATSLPRSADEPAYLRPAPPYVRSDVALFAWCVQCVQPPQIGEQPKRRKSSTGRLRITCFWQHDLRAIWNFGSATAVSQQLSTMMLGLYKVVETRGNRVPVLVGYGHGVSIERTRFQIDRQALTIDYAIHPDEEDAASLNTEGKQGLDELHTAREQKRLTRTIECVLPSSEGWDVQISTKASSEKVQSLPWTAVVTRDASASSSPPSPGGTGAPNIFRVSHAPLPDDHSILKVKVVLELSGPSSGWRLNGIPQAIQTVEERDPTSYVAQKILQDATGSGDISLNTSSSVSTVGSAAESIASGSSTKAPVRAPLTRTLADRPAAAEKSIISRVRRNYIYFSSLLQEPEAKWKQTTELRGVSITQLDSIDPTLVVYRAEATFVGVGLWDLYGALVSPGARTYWDKQHEDGTLLEDVNELTELWHFKTKPAWPVNGRDSVLLKTVYKSPTAIHVFSFSADDPHLFANIPPADANTIRTQVDLQGWAIEALSPTTTLLTLLEQSDPKGWSNKASIPQQMINIVAGVGEFAIKCGGPPVVTRLAGAKANQVRYDHERGSFRIEYEESAGRRTPMTTASEVAANVDTSTLTPVIECELRCDVDTWASSLDIVIDPPPQSISCLRRHRLSGGGGGLWLTITHDAIFTGDERILTIVRKGLGVGKEKNLIMVNGAKVVVDVEELPEAEIKSLTKMKRVKPVRIPLDQPPVMSAIRKRRAEWGTEKADGSAPAEDEKPAVTASSIWGASPRFSSPLTNFFTTAFEQATTSTQQAVAAVSPALGAGEVVLLTATQPPMQYALEALSWLQDSQSHAASTGWTLVSDKGMTVHRKLCAEISPVIPVQKGEKVLEGVSAEEVAAVITSYDCRKQWDDRFDSATLFEDFGAQCHTAFLVSKAGFPFRDRGFYLASVMARARTSSAGVRREAGQADNTGDNRNAIYCVSSSFSPDSVTNFTKSKYDPYALPVGRLFVDGWVLETLDPYTAENYAIPSTRCTRIVAVDFAGSIPAAVNSSINSSIARSILAVETYMKGISPLPMIRMPAPGLVVAEKKQEEPFTISCWKLRRRDEQRLLVASKYDPESRVYHSTLLLKESLSIPIPMPDATPRPSRILLAASPSLASPTISIADTPTPTLSPSPSRMRAASATSDSSTSRDRLRSSSSAFTLKGEIRQSTDLLVAEIVVDSKLYPDGYDVNLRSRIRTDAKHISYPPWADVSSDANKALPIAYAIYTIPASPLHSAGLNADRPPRHLLRLSLPTAQYKISTVDNPLTGETQSPPPKPQWLLDLESKGACVDISIKPADAALNMGTMSVRFDGDEVPVANEKTSLTTLGRDELLDDKISKMAVLSRTAGDIEELPAEFKEPIAVATHLIEPAALSLMVSPVEGDGDSVETLLSLDNSSATPDSAVEPSVPSQTQSNDVAAGGLLALFNTYSAPLSRFATTAPWKMTRAPPARAASPPRTPVRKVSDSLVLPSIPGGLSESSVVSASTMGPVIVPMFPLHTVLIVGIIAFLIGSLLRSLLSPADFIYVVTDLKEAEQISGGWREIKRLLEVKYILGGWDFQIAIVRRH